MSLNYRLDWYPDTWLSSKDQSSPKSLGQSTALHGTLSQYRPTVEC